MRIDDINDTEFQDSTITDVAEDGGSFTMDTGWSFGCPDGITVKVGQRVRLYGSGIGYPVRGLAIDGVVAYYKTKDEAAAEFRAEVEKRKEQRRAEFEASRADRDARIAALPLPFRQRIERFQAANPEFRVEFEPYELFCCEEAVRLVEHAKSRGAASPVDWVRVFADVPVEAQRTLAPTMKLDEHSENTFGCAVMLACTYMEDETLVPSRHGALAPLVGCREYGCHREEAPPTT